MKTILIFVQFGEDEEEIKHKHRLHDFTHEIVDTTKLNNGYMLVVRIYDDLTE